MKSENNHAIRPLAKYIGLSSYLEQVKTKLMPRTSGSADQKCNGSSPYLLQTDGIKAKGKIVFQNFDYD